MSEALSEAFPEVLVSDSAVTGRWHAHLSLDFERRERTVLARRTASGPLAVQKPFYPEGDLCHVYLLHPPGGVVGGDSLIVNAHIGKGAQALLTTPASTKFYRSGGARAEQQQRLYVSAGASLEWLPQESILFDGSRVDCATVVELERGARFMGWELACLGRPASGDRYQCGDFNQRLQLWLDGEPLLLERNCWDAQGACRFAPWGLGGYTVSGSLLAWPADSGMVETVRATLPTLVGARCGVSCVDGVLIVRYLGHHAEQGRNLLKQAWAELRPLVIGRRPCEPRIWNT